MLIDIDTSPVQLPYVICTAALISWLKGYLSLHGWPILNFTLCNRMWTRLVD